MKFLFLYNLLKTYAKRSQFVVLIILLLASQTCNLAQSLVLATAGQKISAGESILWQVALVFILFALPTVLTVFIRSIESKTYFNLYANFVQARLAKSSGRIAAWKKSDQKEAFLSALGPDAEAHLTAIGFSALDIFSFGIGIIGSGVVLGVWIDSAIGISFIFSTLFSSVTYFFLWSQVSQRAESEQVSRLATNSLILKSWDNILIGNQINKQVFFDDLRSKAQDSEEKIFRFQFSAELATCLGTLMALLPLAVSISYVGSQKGWTSPVMIAFLLTLPQQFQLINQFKYIFQQIGTLGGALVKVKTLIESTELSELNLSALVKTEEIVVSKVEGTKVSMSDLESIQRSIAQKSPGRFLITGGNGAGKSTLLTQLKSQSDQSLYLPPKVDLLWNRESGSTELAVEGSSGQVQKRNLLQALSSSANILLLDEWDSNLDAANKRELDQLIERVAETKLVVEVRH